MAHRHVHNEAMEAPLLYTLGHGNRSQDALIGLVTAHRVQALVDVRAQPHSTRFPHFSGDALRSRLEREGIVYHWAGRQLGGRRTALPDSPHTALNEALRGYADHMDTDAFRRAAAQLINMARKSTTAVLCAERLPEHCHRRLIADYLSLQGTAVIHLIEQDESREHLLSPEARRESIRLVYDRNTTAPLGL
ncbi:MAG: DUF488 domain-containing protein [Gammaproteobacteria bacterium]